MATIELENMEFYAFHGCYKEEQMVGNRFLVNATIEGDFSKPAKSDNIEDSVNYLKVYELIRKEMEITSHLLEHITSRILDCIYSNFEGIDKITVKVSKICPPLGGRVEKVSLTMSR